MIIVANERDNNDRLPGIVVPVYRGKSILCNPYHMKSEADRNVVCDLYATDMKIWLSDKPAGRQDIKDEMNRLYTLAKKVDLYLICWCTPKRCHGDCIKQLLEAKLKERGHL